MTKEEKKIYMKKYRQVHKDKIKTCGKKWRQSHIKEIKKYNHDYAKIYYPKNKEKIKNRVMKRYWTNVEKSRINIKVYGKTYRHSHPEKVKIRKKTYYQANLEKYTGYSHRHRALKLGANHEPYTNNYIFQRDGYICQICKHKINKKLKWPHPLSVSIDHIIPLSKGGWDSPINVQAAHLRCNLGKHATNKGQLRLFG